MNCVHSSGPGWINRKDRGRTGRLSHYSLHFESTIRGWNNQVSTSFLKIDLQSICLQIARDNIREGAEIRDEWSQIENGSSEGCKCCTKEGTTLSLLLTTWHVRFILAALNIPSLCSKSVRHITILPIRSLSHLFHYHFSPYWNPSLFILLEKRQISSRAVTILLEVMHQNLGNIRNWEKTTSFRINLA